MHLSYEYMHALPYLLLSTCALQHRSASCERERSLVHVTCGFGFTLSEHMWFPYQERQERATFGKRFGAQIIALDLVHLHAEALRDG
jgi:hypothetical protein